MKKYFILILIIISVNSIFANEKSFKSLDSTIRFVSEDGLWQVGERYGRYRLIVEVLGWEHTRSFLYIQWIENFPKERKLKVISSIPVLEFNQKDWRYFSSATFDYDKYIIRYQNRGRETDQEAILKPGTPGEYKIQIAEEPL